jgi:hypothetical protein
MRRVAILMVAAGFAAYLFVPSARQAVGQGPAADRPGGEFAGKVVGINARVAGATQASILQNVTTRRLGGREFLVGEAVLADDAAQADWKGVVYWFPIDGIESVTVFDDKEKALRVLTAAAASLPKMDKKE